MITTERAEPDSDLQLTCNMAIALTGSDELACPDVGSDNAHKVDSAEEISAPITGLEISFGNIDIHKDAASDCEPFPDYYESCRYFDECDGRIEDFVDKEQEEAYNLAIAKVVEEVIRFKEIDASIVSLPSYVDNKARDVEKATLPVTSDGKPEKYLEDDAKADPEVGNEGSDNEDQPRVFNELGQLLSDPELKPKIKARFTAMANMILSINVRLFYTPTAPEEVKLFLRENDAIAAKELAVEIVKYLAKVDEQLQEYIDVANRVVYMLSVLAQDSSASPYVTFHRMAQVVIK
jgi:hypothetical protein